MKPDKNRRKSYLIDKEFQINFIFGFLIVEIFFIIVIGFLFIFIYYFKYQFGESIFNNYLLIVKKGSSLKVTNMFEIVMPIIIVAGIIIGAFTVGYGLLYSHRIAGPIYRMKRTLTALTRGIFDFKIKLRKGDKFQELTDYINGLISVLNNKMFLIKGNNQEMKGKLTELLRMAERSSLNRKQIRFLLKEIEKHNLIIFRELKSLKVAKTQERINVSA